MKKISTLFLAIVIAGVSFGQKSPLGIEQAAQRKAAGPSHPTTQVVESGNRGAFFFCEDFDFGYSGNNNLNAAWTHSDSGNNTIWIEAADASTAPSGPYSTGTPALASPTVDNGYILFDPDAFNGSTGNETVTGWLQAPEMDMSALNSVIVQYYQYFRYCCFAASPLTLEVSTNGGTDWTVFDAHGSFSPSANSQSDNPLFTKVDISCAAAGHSNVLIRWGYNTDTADGYVAYFWGLDDICIYENQTPNDLEVSTIVNGDIINLWEYRMTPLEQATSAADGGLLAGVFYRNNGTENQTNTVITVEILDAAMNVLSTTTTDPTTVESFANSANCPSYPFDTVYVQTGWVPTDVGSYWIRGSVASADFTDATPEDNSMLYLIEYTVDEYGHDLIDSADVQVGPRPSDNANFFDPTGYGNFYTFPNTGSTAYGITAVFGSNSTADAPFQAILYDATAAGLNGTPAPIVAAYNDFILTGSQINTPEPVYLPFVAPAVIDATKTYFACVLNESESSQELWIVGNSGADIDNSTAQFERAGSGDFVWFGSQQYTPIVRLILSNRPVGVEEQIAVGLDSFYLSPNPATSEARLNFALSGTHAVAYEVRDITGKLIEFKNVGRFAAGQNSITLNVDQYAAGNYIVNLVIDAEHLFTQQLSVQK